MLSVHKDLRPLQATLLLEKLYDRTRIARGIDLCDVELALAVVEADNLAQLSFEDAQERPAHRASDVGDGGSLPRAMLYDTVLPGSPPPKLCPCLSILAESVVLLTPVASAAYAVRATAQTFYRRPRANLIRLLVRRPRVYRKESAQTRFFEPRATTWSAEA